MGFSPKTGRHYPIKSWALWRDGVVSQLLAQRKPESTINENVWFEVDYYPSDRRRRDVPGLMDALWHCLEKARIVEDDKFLSSGTWRTWPVQKEGSVVVNLYDKVCP